MRFLGVFGVVASLAVSAASANAQSDIPPKLEGQKAIQAITGSTIVGYGPYGRFVMFIAADHTLDILAKGKREMEQWSFKDNRFCILHESPCPKLTVFGTQGILDTGGTVIPFNIEPGNQVDVYAAKG